MNNDHQAFARELGKTVAAGLGTQCDICAVLGHDEAGALVSAAGGGEALAVVLLEE